MRIKRYVVDSMPDALQRIRTDLGKDAVILNTKEIRSGGFLGLFAKKKIEVIAASDHGPSGASPVVTRPPAPPLVPGVTLSEAAAAYSTVATAVAVREKSGASSSAGTTPLRAAEETYAPPSVGFSARTKPQEDELLEEIKQMKHMMVQLTRSNREVAPYPPEIGKYESRLLDQEVSPELTERILRKATDDFLNDSSPKTEQFAYEAVRKQLRNILTGSNPKTIAPDTRIAHFVGPTGVGKTTTIAKLAALQVLKHNRKVGFITSDTYRIAAVEQLKTYANILNIPLEVVFSPQELTRAFQQLQDRDIIFMDTAGRNFRNLMYVSELNSLLQSQGKSETYLVLSLTSKYKDMKAIAENFAKFKLDKVLFTKMDETHTYGSIVNLLHDFPVQLSYITNGQNVPDDIIEINEEKLIDLLLEERDV